ncbi:unnamed protein product [Rotaria sp. Silwood1]|nr:unnamed protein product [Rotaria sp. Silwood1]
MQSILLTTHYLNLYGLGLHNNDENTTIYIYFADENNQLLMHFPVNDYINENDGSLKDFDEFIIKIKNEIYALSQRKVKIDKNKEKELQQQQNSTKVNQFDAAKNNDMDVDVCFPHHGLFPAEYLNRMFNNIAGYLIDIHAAISSVSLILHCCSIKSFVICSLPIFNCGIEKLLKQRIFIERTK